MSKKVSTPKQSGGGGYTFADKVAASFLLKMLLGIPVLKAEAGQIKSVHFEKIVDGWFLDDLVLQLQGSNGSVSALAVSIKSNRQITSNGFPADFTRTVWEQRLHVDTDKFDPDRDYLGLVTTPLGVDVKSAWDNLLQKAVDSDPAEFATRIATPKFGNQIERKIFESLHCPHELDSSKTPTDTTHLLLRLRHFQFDFEGVPSNDENEVEDRCGQLLRDGGQAEGSALWTKL